MTSSLPQVQEQQGRPIGRRPVSVRKGSRGRELGGQGARVEDAPWGEMQAGAHDLHMRLIYESCMSRPLIRCMRAIHEGV